MKKFIFVFLFLGIFLACTNDQETKKPIERSMFFWKTNFSLNESEQKILKDLKIKRLYIRYFDLDYSANFQKTIPVGNIEKNCNEEIIFLNNFFITPCIFITNSVMEKSSETDLAELVEKTKRKIEKINNEFAETFASIKSSYSNDDSLRNVLRKEWLKNCDEILFDCDWTEKTKNKYFSFLKQIKKLFPDKKIAATIRLWQVKFQEKAGIPPVESGLLMCYGTGNPKEYGINNSIAELNEVKKYLNTEYKLPIDIVLPIFNWAVLFRNSQFKTLMSNFNLQNVEDDTVTFEKVKQNLFRFKKDTTISNVYIRFGDEIRIEQLEISEINNLINILKEKISLKNNIRIGLFSFDTLNIKRFGVKNLNNFYEKFE